MGLTVTLREYKFKSALAALAGSGRNGSAPVRKRTDEQVTPQTYTVKGDTLWDIACRLYGDGTEWGAYRRQKRRDKPRKLQIGKVLTL